MSNKQALRITCTFLGLCLIASGVPRSAAGGSSLPARPQASKARLQRTPTLSDENKSIGCVTALFTQAVPIRLSTPTSSVSTGSTFTCTVSVQSVPAGGGYVQIYCDTPGAFTAPGGSWPVTVNFPDGASTTASFTLTANSVSTTTSAKLYSGATGFNPSDPSQWTCSGTVVVSAPSAKSVVFNPSRNTLGLTLLAGRERRRQ